jgi:hypothetical protein
LRGAAGWHRRAVALAPAGVWEGTAVRPFVSSPLALLGAIVLAGSAGAASISVSLTTDASSCQNGTSNGANESSVCS